MKLTKAGKIKLGSSFIVKGGHVCYRVLANNKHKCIIDFDGREMICAICLTNSINGYTWVYADEEVFV